MASASDQPHDSYKDVTFSVYAIYNFEYDGSRRVVHTVQLGVRSYRTIAFLFLYFVTKSPTLVTLASQCHTRGKVVL